MLSIGKIKLAGESYYLDGVADGIDRYRCVAFAEGDDIVIAWRPDHI